MPNIAKIKLYLPDLVLVMSKNTPVGGSPVVLRPMPGDTITIQFMSAEEAVKGKES